MIDARGELIALASDIRRKSQINILSFCPKTWHNKISSERTAAKNIDGNKDQVGAKHPVWQAWKLWDFSEHPGGL